MHSSDEDTYDGEVLLAMFIGINDFQRDIVPDLNYCCNDAKAIHSAFRDYGDANAPILLVDEQATRRNILTLLNAFMSSVRPGEVLLIYVATHGIVKYNDFFFLPYDGDEDNLLGTAISSKLLINALASIKDRGAKCLLVFDCCYCGSIGFDISKSQTEGRGGLSCLFSASPSETAIESRKIEHGWFSYFMAEGLKGKADRHGRGKITLRDLYDYVYTETQRASKKRQHPVLIGTLDDETVLREFRQNSNDWPTSSVVDTH